MFLQIEYCTDIHKSLHPVIDFIFLFYNTCRHDRGRVDRFNVTKIYSSYGRTQREMQPKKINQVVGCLGPHEKILEVGYEKHVLFQEGDYAPLCITL